MILSPLVFPVFTIIVRARERHVVFSHTRISAPEPVGAAVQDQAVVVGAAARLSLPPDGEVKGRPVDPLPLPLVVDVGGTDVSPCVSVTWCQCDNMMCKRVYMTMCRC